MAKLTLKKALTDVTVYLFVQDSSKTTGEGLSGLAYNTANLVASYVRPLGSRTAITLNTLAAVTSAHADGGFKEIDATNMPGVYRLDLPDAVCATGVPSAVVMLKGASNMTPVLLEIQLTDFDLNSTSNTVGTVTNLTNLPAMPNDWLTAAGIAADVGAEIADAVWDEAISGHTTAGSFGAKNQKVVPSETIGDYKADVSSLATSAALATVAGYIDTEVAAIKAKTDNLPASPAAVGSAMTLATNAITAAVIATDAIDADAIKTDAVTKIQNGLATPTNITAGTITTVTNLTNLPAMPNDWLTAAGVKADAVTKIATGVWASATRTLSSFGTLVADIWASATRTLSSFGFTVATNSDANVTAIKAKTDNLPASPAAVGSAMTLSNNAITAAVIATDAIDADAIKADAITEIATGVWASATRTLSSFGTLVSDIWSTATRTLSSFGFTVATNSDANVTAIKAKTDNLPAVPANEATLTDIKGVGWTDQTLMALKTVLDTINSNTLDAEGVRSAIGLEEGNLDRILNNIYANKQTLSISDTIRMSGVPTDIVLPFIEKDGDGRGLVRIDDPAEDGAVAIIFTQTNGILFASLTPISYMGYAMGTYKMHITAEMAINDSLVYVVLPGHTSFRVIYGTISFIKSAGSSIDPDVFKADVSDLATAANLQTVDDNVDAIKSKTDNLPSIPAAVGSAMTLTSGERTAIANEVEAQIINETDSEKVLKAITDKIAEVNPSLDDLTLAGIASAVRTELTIELARIDAAISSRLSSVGYTAPDNASVTAIKAKTDQLAFTVANQVDANALTGSTSPADIADAVWDEAIAGHVTAGSFGAKNQKVVPSESLNDYKADISSLALESTLTAIKGIGWTSETLKEIKNRIDALPIGISTADIMNTVVEGTFTLQDVLKIMAGALAGKLDGGGTGTLTFRNLSDTLDRIIAEVDLSNGNRDNITLDLT